MNIKSKLLSVYYRLRSLISVKADRVGSATAGNFAALDSNGNLVDSGHSHSTYLTSHQSLSGYVPTSRTVAGKALSDNVTLGTLAFRNAANSGNVVTYNGSGNLNLTKANLASMGALTAHQDISGKADKSEMSVVAGTGSDADKTTITLKNGTSATVLTAHQSIGVSGLSDVSISSAADGQVLKYDGTSGKWVNAAESGGGGGGGGLGSGYTLTVISDPNGSYSSNVIALLADGSCVKAGVDYGDAVIDNVVEFIEHEYAHGIRKAGFLVQNTTAYYGPGCFVGGTMVLLSDGSEKPVEEITFADSIAVWDFDNGRMSSATPLWIKKPQTTDHLWVNRFEDGRVILTTGTVAGHRFFSVDAAKFLYNTECVGHMVRLADGSSTRLLSAEREERECRYYNVITRYHMNLYANGILTSFHLNNSLYRIDPDSMAFVKPEYRNARLATEFPGVPEDWFDGLRLGEQTATSSDIVSDVTWRRSIQLPQ